MMTKFTRRQELGKSNPKMILVSLEPEEKVAFSPGDHMIMYPTNAVEEVDFLLSKFIDKDKRHALRKKYYNCKSADPTRVGI